MLGLRNPVSSLVRIGVSKKDLTGRSTNVHKFVSSLSLSFSSQPLSIHPIDSTIVSPLSGRTNVEIETDESTNDVQKYILNRNPADNSLIQKVKCSTLSELDSKIESLQYEQEKVWSRIPLSKRVDILRNAFRNAFDSSNDGDNETQLAQLISKEMGKTLAESKDEVHSILEMKNHVLDFIHKVNQPLEISPDNESMGSSDNATMAILMRDPLGVIGVLSPWNFPAGELLLHVLPALVAGNSVLVKPSELTPLTGQFIVNRLRDYTFTFDNRSLKLPIDIVQGDKEIGQAIVQHSNIHSISMTGSSSVGKQLIRQSSFPNNIKRLILELGGKDPMIVFQDADLSLAAKHAVLGSTYNAGQVCCSVERIYVDRAVKSEFEQLCILECQNITAGPWTNEQSCMGPLVSRLQRERVEAQVNDAIERGGKVLCMGPILEENGGNYFPATLITNLDKSMDITQNETFGPIIAIYEFDGSEEQAVEYANDSEYGLSACVYSKNIQKAARVASNIRTGQIAINTWVMAGDISTPLECPWVGHKESGFGYHSGIEGYKQFSVPKSIMMASNKNSKLSDILV